MAMLHMNVSTNNAVLRLSRKQDAGADAAEPASRHAVMCQSGKCTCAAVLGMFAQGKVKSERTFLQSLPLHSSIHRGAWVPPMKDDHRIIETDEARRAQRAKQVEHGRNTTGYMRYRWLVPR
jgi:hypothetical protein